MTDRDEAALTLLIMGRTATSAAKAIIAAGWHPPHQLPPQEIPLTTAEREFIKAVEVKRL